MSERPSQLLYPAFAVALVALAMPLEAGGSAVMGSPLMLPTGGLVFAALISLWQPRWQLLLTGIAAHAAAIALIAALPDLEGPPGLGFWAVVVAAWLAAWAFAQSLSALKVGGPGLRRLVSLAVPVVFGLWILILWEILVRGFVVPPVLLPAPSQIWAQIVSRPMILWDDFRQTFLKSVLAGYVIGCLTGFLVAILVDRVAFLRRGLLPIGNLASALPMVGIAPIMVMWFGPFWPSKAAVVVVMTFFPMLVNTVAGLAASGLQERDLMRTYAAGYWQALAKLRLPAALPFIFNALKINATLALIGAIVAENFGSVTVGMGFRISTEVGRLAIDMVWAEIAVAALAGSVFYGLISAIERFFTFWHPSYRS